MPAKESLNILMLGWEYPPVVSGGLGTATEGLIKGLTELGHFVTLVLPYYPYNSRPRPGLQILSPSNIDRYLRAGRRGRQMRAFERGMVAPPNTESTLPPIQSHYETRGLDLSAFTEDHKRNIDQKLKSMEKARKVPTRTFEGIVEQVYVLTEITKKILSAKKDFDVVHAHDWMTFPALDAAREISEIPTVAHFHSTEFDRAGLHGNGQIVDVESAELSKADAIITVSEYSKKMIATAYHCDIRNIDVVYNAGNEQHLFLEEREAEKEAEILHEEHEDRPPTVTFVGRVTFQKGPMYFVKAAEQVLESVPETKFSVVGAGDLLPSMQQEVKARGMWDAFSFEGFLGPNAVRKKLQTSDVFVMPSVSEPFGIVALEAIQQHIPVIISKQAGVSEVFRHVFKVDFWDVDRTSDLILSLIKYPTIRWEIARHAFQEMRKLNWLASAQMCESVYLRLMA